ncbi:hypothetical protein BHU72_08545 [Desulfuribacillus stibiiarsenatis]|uniref:Proteinase inhibitor n=1 Tax=Desulfuribacillus stibiiarsenatis TaxID=1390249 RepID=A0A1E5L331_9FIRM|nr:YkgJ family cysteine cluster protein [Desulfuribacillus stibiiarsenatis]OEH84548.1 hypothetical protein BHU72_08545 [Desulfuribacillus stibiiarsenatis]
MDCRTECGACCVALSISSPIPGMPNGKPAGVACIHLATNKRCNIFNDSGRPKVCDALKPSKEMCGTSMDEALHYLNHLEKATAPKLNS